MVFSISHCRVNLGHQHIKAIHPDRHCAPCKQSFATEDMLHEHYLESSVHPRCYECDTGFADAAGLQEVRRTVDTI
jgi:hypothetical protein